MKNKRRRLQIARIPTFSKSFGGIRPLLAFGLQRARFYQVNGQLGDLVTALGDILVCVDLAKVGRETDAPAVFEFFENPIDNNRTFRHTPESAEMEVADRIIEKPIVESPSEEHISVNSFLNGHWK
jgi:hypothetical protein